MPDARAEPHWPPQRRLPPPPRLCLPRQRRGGRLRAAWHLAKVGATRRSRCPVRPGGRGHGTGGRPGCRSPVLPRPSNSSPFERLSCSQPDAAPVGGGVERRSPASRGRAPLAHERRSAKLAKFIQRQTRQIQSASRVRAFSRSRGRAPLLLEGRRGARKAGGRRRASRRRQAVASRPSVASRPA